MYQLFKAALQSQHLPTAIVISMPGKVQKTPLTIAIDCFHCLSTLLIHTHTQFDSGRIKSYKGSMIIGHRKLMQHIQYVASSE